jgi:hypothetical protein
MKVGLNINARGWFILMYLPASTTAYTKNEIVAHIKHTRGTR